MDEGAKRRLVGAVVIVSLAVILVPMLFEDDSLAPREGQALLPDEPLFEDDFVLDPDQFAEDPGAFTVESDLLSEPYEPGESIVLEGQPGQLGTAPAAPPDVAPSASASAPAPPRPAPPATPPRRAPSETPAASPPRRAAVASTPPPRARDDAVPSWVVQVASFGSSASADGLAEKLKSAGFTAFVEQAQVRGKRYFRVRVGPETSRKSAERTAATLRERQKLDTLIHRYP